MKKKHCSPHPVIFPMSNPIVPTMDPFPTPHPCHLLCTHCHFWYPSSSMSQMVQVGGRGIGYWVWMQQVQSWAPEPAEHCFWIMESLSKLSEYIWDLNESLPLTWQSDISIRRDIGLTTGWPLTQLLPLCSSSFRWEMEWDSPCNWQSKTLRSSDCQSVKEEKKTRRESLPPSQEHIQPPFSPAASRTCCGRELTYSAMMKEKNMRNVLQWPSNSALMWLSSFFLSDEVRCPRTLGSQCSSAVTYYWVRNWLTKLYVSSCRAYSSWAVVAVEK